jgi:uncharacterized protein (TIGR02594 family)
MNYNKAILTAARAYIGLQEWPGARHNPEILEMFAEAGHSWVSDDETPWCAAFANSVLGEVGLQGTGKLNARSFEKWGREIPTHQAVPGDIVVFWRGSRDSWQGHVAFFTGFSDRGVMVVGGNQKNGAVTETPYSMERVLCVRRADPAAQDSDRPTLRAGDRGVIVQDLQAILGDLNYHNGRMDGVFGPLTRAAVLAFQADNDLESDGVVGPLTWEALKTAEPRPDRDVSLDDLREERDEAVRAADTTEIATIAGGGVGLFGAGLEIFREYGATIEALTLFLRQNWLLVLGAGVVIFAVLAATRRIKRERVEKAKKGALLG